MPVAQFGKTWAVTFRFKPFPVAQRQRERREEERKGLGAMFIVSLSVSRAEGMGQRSLGLESVATYGHFKKANLV